MPYALSRRSFLRGVGAVEAERPRPNLGSIPVADSGRRDVGCRGSRLGEAPNVDRLPGRPASAAWQGLSPARQGKTVVCATFDPQPRLTIQVVPNMPGHKRSLPVAGETLTRGLPKDLAASRFVG